MCNTRLPRAAKDTMAATTMMLVHTNAIANAYFPWPLQGSGQVLPGSLGLGSRLKLVDSILLWEEDRGNEEENKEGRC